MANYRSLLSAGVLVIVALLFVIPAAYCEELAKEDTKVTKGT